MSHAYEVTARRDRDGGVWVAESEDIPGLAAEAATPNELMAKLRVLIPELLELNGALPKNSSNLDFMIRYEHEENGVVALALPATGPC